MSLQHREEMANDPDVMTLADEFRAKHQPDLLPAGSLDRIGEGIVSRTSTGLRFPTELHAAMTQAATERGLSLNGLVVRLCIEGMERLVPVEELRLTR